MKKSYIFLAEGFEETEAIMTVDVMRRAGMPVEMLSISSRREVAGAHGITVLADGLGARTPLADAEWLICPGGLPGAVNLHECLPLAEALKRHAAKDGLIAAICASPAMVLAPLGLLKGRKATCYPGCEQEAKANGAIMVDERVVVDGNIITGNGPSSTLPFALAIVAKSMGQHIADQVGTGMLYYPAAPKYEF